MVLMMKLWNKNESQQEDFLGGPMVKNPPDNSGSMGSNPGPGRFHLLQDS